MRGELGSLYFSWAIWSVIFCFPVLCQFGDAVRCGREEHTVSAGLHRSLNIPNALHGDAVLVISVDILVLEFAYFV